MKVKDNFSKISMKVPGASLFEIDSSLDDIDGGIYSYSEFLSRNIYRLAEYCLGEFFGGTLISRGKPKKNLPKKVPVIKLL